MASWYPTTLACRLQSGDKVKGRTAKTTGRVTSTTYPGNGDLVVRLRNDEGRLLHERMTPSSVYVLQPGSNIRHRGVEFDFDGNHGYPYRAYCNTCGWRSVGYVRWHAAHGMAEHHGCDGADARDELARFAQITRGRSK
ncbi:hypothetical protein K8O93_01030 [Gordonia bronchialis]|uniref:hypothetical protein n=1 Tax=Gordonia bronchialis TaxID=2054 RepID=UPI001CC04D7E|nr:hypothetical protein [Gordonia bronchialis]UAK38417.1 hypothetical protein K8O93_01030 [Gordonia bronchialis]